MDIFAENLPSWATENLLGLEKWQWLGIFAGILLSFITKTIVQFIVGILIKATVKKENSLRHQLLLKVESPAGLIMAAGTWYLSVHALKLDGKPEAFLIGIAQLLLCVGITWAVYNLSDILTDILGKLAQKTESELDDQLVPLVSKSLRVFIVIIGVLATIQNFGVNVMSLLAGLGLGGLAFALAAKDTAANLFGSIMIILDRPFKTGDWIITTKGEGTVEEVGFRSTKIRSFYNSVVSIPNSVLANESIDNMGRREFRRYSKTLGITYGTPSEKINEFIEGIRNIIQQHPATNKENYHVYFRDYGDFSLNIMLYYFVKVPDWGTEMKENQDINLKIYTLAEKLGVSFAFPTQSLYVESLPQNTDASR